MKQPVKYAVAQPEKTATRQDWFQWISLTTGRISQHLIASGFYCRGTLQWKKQEVAQTGYRRYTKGYQKCRKLSLSFMGLLTPFYLSLPSLLSLTFQFPETCRGQKASSKEECKFLKFHLPGCERGMVRVWGGLVVQQETWKTLQHDDTKDWIALKLLLSAGHWLTYTEWANARE